MEGQNWNNVLEYVKLGLGAPVNLIEISDEELVGYLKRHVMPLFSQYCPAIKFTYISEANLVTSGAPGSPMYQYRIPTQPDEYIVDILEVYPLRDSSIYDIYGTAINNPHIAVDMTILNSFLDLLKSLTVYNTWQFIPPNTLIFDREIRGAVVVYNTPHTTLDTVRPDLYHQAFKPLCLGYTKIWLAQMRSKYEGLNTPFGPININYDRLQSEGQMMIEQAIAILEAVPPDILLEIL